MIFWILTPVLPRTWVPPFWGGGQNFFAYCGRCVCIWTWVLKNFFLENDPLTHGGGPGSQLRVPPVRPPHMAPCGEDLAVFTVDRLFSGKHRGDVSSRLVRHSPPPHPCPPGPLRCQGSTATGHAYGGTEGARKFFSFPLPILSTLHPNTILEHNLDSNTHPNPQPTPNPTRKSSP